MTNGAARPSGSLRRARGFVADRLVQVWLFVALLFALATALTVWVVPHLPEATATPVVAWPLLAVAFALCELPRVHMHVRGEARTFTFSEVPVVIV